VAAPEDVIIVPLEVVALRSEAWPTTSVSATFEAGLPRLLDDLNAMFEAGHVRFALAGVTQTVLIAHDGGPMKPTVAQVIEALPPVAAPRNGLRVYFAGGLDVNGVAVGTRAALVAERAQLRRVHGGSEDPPARVTGHMVGGLLGLEAVGQEANLMALGTSGADLDAGQIETVRARARRLLVEQRLTAP
jgi:hypothetical protein